MKRNSIVLDTNIVKQPIERMLRITIERGKYLKKSGNRSTWLKNLSFLPTVTRLEN